MKKIMFSDKFALTKAVLEGRKTMTRRLVPGKTLACANDYVQQIHGTGHDYLDYLLDNSAYKLGEIVAAAQSYKDIREELGKSGVSPFVAKAGYRNKMYVRADLMPHQICITNVRVERLQDISDEDCIREGIFLRPAKDIRREFDTEYTFGTGKYHAATPKAAFAVLIDATCGQGTWQSNPWVFVYGFELIK